MTLPVILLSDFNIGVFERFLRFDEAEPALEVEAAAYDQLVPALAEGPDRREAVALVWGRPEGMLPSFRRAWEDGAAVDPAALLAEVDDVADLVTRAASRHRHVLVVAWVLPPDDGGLGVLDWVPGVGLRHLLAVANLRLAGRLAELPNAHLLDPEPWLRAGGAGAASPKQWFAGKVPYANAVFQRAVVDVKAAVASLVRAPRKLLVLDLDDTLWGGVIGDVGWEGLRLGGHDHVGEAFQAFQRALKALTRRGVLLGIVSKNTESVALEAITRHPEMVLGLEDVAGWRINWDDKAANVAALVADLGVGLDAVVFIDDNPAERDRVRGAWPDVLVPDWPADPARFTAALRALRCFDAPALSDEDRARAGMYAVERQRRASQTSAESVEGWLAKLGLEVEVADLDRSNLPRVAQLLNKTNQLNLRNRRCSEVELAMWAATPGHQLVAASVADRFGPAGLTGVVGLEVVGETARVSDLVLSCRVMGRRIEEALLHVAVERARRAGAATLVAELVPTDRNAPCLDVLRASGLTEVAEHVFTWDCRSPYPVPGHVALVDGTGR